MRGPVRDALSRVGLLELAFRLRDRWRSLAYLGRNPAIGPDGLPLPSPDLIRLVAGTSDVAWFLKAGEKAAESIASALTKRGVDLASGGSILDFGCGCGRVVRHWSRMRARIHGCDANPLLVEWCRRNLPFAAFEVNRAKPPLPYADGAFDLVCALSVFTHFPAHLQQPWIEELHRVTRPGGHVMLSVHGESYVPELTPDERRRFEAGELVVRGADAVGRNACAAFHPPAYVHRVLGGRFKVVDHLPQGAAGNPDQDLVVLNKES